MKKFEKILFGYSIIAVTLIFITSGLFAPSPQNLISAALLLPILAFFWLRVTNPQSVTVAKWSARLLIVIGLLSSMSIYAFILGGTITGGGQKQADLVAQEYQGKVSQLEEEIEKLNQEAKTSEELAEELSDIKDELKALNLEGKLILGTQNQSSQLGDLLKELEENEDKIPLGNVSLSSDLVKEVSAYDEPNFSAVTVGTINYGVSYPYFEVNGSWYQIRLADETLGWVHERDVDVAE